MATGGRPPAIRRALAAALIVFAASAAPGAARAADLTVAVTGMRSGAGLVHFGLYDDPATFPDRDGRIRGSEEPIREGRAVTVFRDLRPGRYAVAVFHDENANGEFDQAVLGIPLEDFAFSRGARVFLGPPAFADAAIDLPAGGARITLSLD